VVICIADGSHFARERLMAFTLWHPDAVSGSHPPRRVRPDHPGGMGSLGNGMARVASAVSQSSGEDDQFEIV
jgi:hypothetical protein